MGLLRVLLVAVALSFVGVARATAQSCNGSSSGVSAENAGRGWTATWFDDFDFFDTSKWNNVESLQNNWSPGINVPSHAWTGDGKLHITSTWEETRGIYLSGQVTTKPSSAIGNGVDPTPVPDSHPLAGFREGGTQTASAGFSFKYGRIEFCVKAPAYWNGTAYTSAGAHFAVWLLPTDGTWPPELDVAESYAGIGIIDQNVHYGSWPGNLKSNGQRSSWNSTGQFNLYAMEWSDTDVRVFVNGTLMKVMNSSAAAMLKDGYSAIAQLNATTGFYLIIDTQLAETTTGPLDTGTGSTETLVDWVKVYYRPDSTESYSHCSWENGLCSFSGTRTVRYGANGFYVFKESVSSSIPCTNVAFGTDPIFGVTKSCAYGDTTPTQKESYTHCSWENGTCSFSGTRTVRYGADGFYVYKESVSSGIACTNNAFGSDPVFGVLKSCAYTDVAPPSAYTHCAWENDTCSFNGTKQVRYGANNSYIFKQITGAIACTNAAFGDDPLPGVVKSCSFW